MTDWKLWGIRAVISWLVGSATAFGIAFKVSDYITDKAVGGLNTSVSTLSSTVDSLSATVSQVNTTLTEQLVALERERSKLAVEIARELKELEGDQKLQGQDIDFLRDSLNRIERRVQDIQSTMKIRFTVDGGKTFEELDPTPETLEAIYTRAKSAGEKDGYVVTPFNVIRLGEQQ